MPFQTHTLSPHAPPRISFTFLLCPELPKNETLQPTRRTSCHSARSRLTTTSQQEKYILSRITLPCVTRVDSPYVTLISRAILVPTRPVEPRCFHPPQTLSGYNFSH